MRLIDADAIITENPEVIEALRNAPTVEDAVVLPFVPGGDLWYVDEDDGYQVKQYTDERDCISGVAVFADRFEIIGYMGDIYEAGKDFSCTSKEEANEVRRKLLKEKFGTEK